MKFKVKYGYRDVVTEMEASDLFTPEPYLGWEHHGVAETAQQKAEVAAEAVGKLLATLRQKGILTSSECLDISGTVAEIIAEV